MSNQPASSSTSPPQEAPHELQQPAEPDEPPAEPDEPPAEPDEPPAEQDEDWGKWKPNEPAEPPPGWKPDHDWMDIQTSWEGILRDWSCDPHSSLQLKLLAQVDRIAAADIIWKLTKVREDPIENPSAFVNKCVTQARKAMMDRGRW